MYVDLYTAFTDDQKRAEIARLSTILLRLEEGDSEVRIDDEDTGSVIYVAADKDALSRRIFGLQRSLGLACRRAVGIHYGG